MQMSIFLMERKKSQETKNKLEGSICFLKNDSQVNISNTEKAPKSWFFLNAKTKNRQFIEDEILMTNKR